MGNGEKRVIPIFIITCDRLEILKKSIQSYYDCIKTPFEIVIRDQGSAFKPTIEFLKDLESKGTKIYWAERITDRIELNKLDESIQDYFKTHPKSNYVVTNDDVALDNAEGDVLEVYAYCLNILPNIKVAGPMLRIDDIPDYYPLKEDLLSGKRGCHKDFHSRPVKVIDYRGKQIKYIHAPIDVTFGMYRKETHWRKHQQGIRTYPPYSARHLDWYIDPKNLTEDQKYYIEHSSDGITHWSSWIKKWIEK